MNPALPAIERFAEDRKGGVNSRPSRRKIEMDLYRMCQE